MYPKSLQNLIESFKILPGVGQKTAERYALHLLDLDERDVLALAENIVEAKKNTIFCSNCGNYAEEDICDICKNEHRDHKTICVVASPKEVMAIENMGDYLGVYHVLGGLISTKKGILPDDLNISKLLERSEDAKEIIIALNATVEGEMTSLYLIKKMNNKNITRLAFGLPIGGHLDYADDMTIVKAFEGRNKVSDN